MWLGINYVIMANHMILGTIGGSRTSPCDGYGEPLNEGLSGYNVESLTLVIGP